MINSMIHRWYVVQTKARKEDIVANILNNADFEVFNPKIKENGVIKSLFPTYIFAHLDLNEPMNYRKVKYAIGVKKILGYNHTPIPIDDEVICIIKNRMDNNGIIRIGSTFIPGDRVRVKKGPLMDLIGILESPVSDKGRVKILLTIVNYSARIILDSSILEKIE